MLFSRKLAILLAYFPFFNYKNEYKNTARVIANLIDNSTCYQSKSNLDKCILNLVTSAQYQPHSNTQIQAEKDFVDQYKSNENDLKKAHFIGEVYPKKQAYDVAVLVYDSNHGIEVFREKIIFLNRLYNLGYKWKYVEIIVDSTKKHYSFQDMSILNNQSTVLKIRDYNITRSAVNPSSDLELVGVLLQQMNLPIGEVIRFYSQDKKVSQVMRDWAANNKHLRAIDVQLNPMIPYYQARWNEYYNYSSNKIEVIGGAGVTNDAGYTSLYRNANISLNSIGLFYKYANQYRF